MSYEGAITPANITLSGETTRTDGQNLMLDGWTDVRGGTTKKWNPATQQTFTEKENTIYAVWKEKSCTCTSLKLGSDRIWC